MSPSLVVSIDNISLKISIFAKSLQLYAVCKLIVKSLKLFTSSKSVMLHENTIALSGEKSSHHVITILAEA